jgi:nucleotide-binding universal stress UspA family protein
MIKRILVPTDGSEAANCGVRFALSLAKQFDACLQGLHVVDVKLLEGPFLRDLSASLGTAPYVNYQGNIAMILEERGNAALEVFRKACDEAGIRCDTSQVNGVVHREIAEHGELADLIVLGRSGEHSPWLEGLLGSTTEAVVRRARGPVLVTGNDAFTCEQILVAYDGGDFSRHALRIGAEWAAHLHARIHVLSMGNDSARQRLDEAQEYLQAHDVEVTLEHREGDASEGIVAYAAECGAGLLVMGAYGHGKVREFVLGSRTSYALNHAPCPVLLVR